MVTVVADRESDIAIEWARVPAPNVHPITRVMTDRRPHDGGKRYAFAAALPAADPRALKLRARPGRPRRTARLTLRFARLTLCRPKNTAARALPERVTPTLVEVVELQPPAGGEPLQRRLLTRHEVADVKSAWQIVEWYAQRWTIGRCSG